MEVLGKNYPVRTAALEVHEKFRDGISPGAYQTYPRIVSYSDYNHAKSVRNRQKHKSLRLATIVLVFPDLTIQNLQGCVIRFCT